MKFSSWVALGGLATFLARAEPILWSENGHYYELVRTNIAYPDAIHEAGQRVHGGWRGHLATITSAAENSFITSSLRTGGGAEFAWLAGREPNDDGRWLWDAGPERGLQFSSNTTPTPPFYYANWGGIEPNDNKPNEDYLMMNIGSDFAGIGLGQWADAAPDPNPSDPVIGYIVEFEPPLPLLSITRGATPATVQLSFTTVTNQTYRVQYLTEVTSTNWMNLGAALSGDGGTQTVSDSVLSNVTRFYRLCVSE